MYSEKTTKFWKKNPNYFDIAYVIFVGSSDGQILKTKVWCLQKKREKDKVKHPTYYNARMAPGEVG